MQVIGYTSEKRLVRVELSGEAIARGGIDPWRVDLFDPQPIELMVKGRVLRFSRLRNIAFAYATGDAPQQVFIGMRDESCQTCVRAECVGEPGEDHFKVMSKSDRRFADHLADYLDKRFPPKPQAAAGDRDPLVNHEEVHALFLPDFHVPMHYRSRRGVDVPVKINAARTYAPRPTTDVFLVGPRVQFGSEHTGKINTCRFSGEACREMPVLTKLPAAINQVHQWLGCLQPSVVGKSLRQALLDKQPPEVVFLIRPKWMKAGLRMVEKIDGVTFPERTDRETPLDPDALFFEYGGCRYVGLSSMDTEAWLISHCYYTPTRLCSRRKDEVLACRLALYDLGRRQARFCVPDDSLRHVKSERPGCDTKESLESDGFSLLSLETIETSDQGS